MNPEHIRSIPANLRRATAILALILVLATGAAFAQNDRPLRKPGGEFKNERKTEPAAKQETPKPVVEESEPKAADSETTDTSGVESRPIDDEETLAIVRKVEQRVEMMRGIYRAEPIPARYITDAGLRQLIEKAFEEDIGAETYRGVTAMLQSVKILPEDMNLRDMYADLLDEQAGGLYDSKTKRLYVREHFDIASSEMAQAILAHEICHALQDYKYNLAKLGADQNENDDLSLAATALAEGDATLLMNQYVATYGSQEMLKDLPDMLTMDQSALKSTPLFFRRQFFFPYVQGEALLTAAENTEGWNRERLFKEPPTTTEQVMHPETKYLTDRDTPSSVALLTESPRSFPTKPLPPDPPKGYKKVETNQLGELGLRLLFEDALGRSMASEVAAGWDGDAYVIYDGPDDHWWFCFETVWDTNDDAGLFARACVTFWRVLADDDSIGSVGNDSQTFQAGKWKVRLERVGNRAIVSWGDGA